MRGSRKIPTIIIPDTLHAQRLSKKKKFTDNDGYSMMYFMYLLLLNAMMLKT